MSTAIVYEWGYRGQVEDQFIARVRRDSRLVVVDVRYGFVGPARPFSQKRLKEALPGQYKHARSLGNLNYREPLGSGPWRGGDTRPARRRARADPDVRV